jgi:DUF1680 family protein
MGTGPSDCSTTASAPPCRSRPVAENNLYVPSKLTWNRARGRLSVTQDTTYPESETSTLTIDAAESIEPCALKFRVPVWTKEMTIAVDGVKTNALCTPGTWASVARAWNTGDRLDVRIPLRWRMVPVDRWHPDRVAVVRGPVVFVLEAAYHDPFFRLPERDDELERWLVPDQGGQPTAILSPADPARIPSSAVFRVVPPDKSPVRLKLRPFYDVPEATEGFA